MAWRWRTTIPAESTSTPALAMPAIRRRRPTDRCSARAPSSPSRRCWRSRPAGRSGRATSVVAAPRADRPGEVAEVVERRAGGPCRRRCPQPAAATEAAAYRQQADANADDQRSYAARQHVPQRNGAVRNTMVCKRRHRRLHSATPCRYAALGTNDIFRSRRSACRYPTAVAVVKFYSAARRGAQARRGTWFHLAADPTASSLSSIATSVQRTAAPAGPPASASRRARGRSAGRRAAASPRPASACPTRCSRLRRRASRRLRGRAWRPRPRRRGSRSRAPVASPRSAADATEMPSSSPIRW